MRKRLFAVLLLLMATPFFTACSTIGYYAQAVNGHLKLMRARQPIADLLASDSTDETLREQLQTLLDAREFAVESLQLPDNDSYSTYAETGRQAVTWNVVAAPEFSMSPKTWCFPVAGCVSYRGYFDRADADNYAEVLAADGFDVTVGGASAYSTLGWFEDPVLDTMLRGGEIRYVGTLFHELAHQLLYVKDDSTFNEAFASFVEQQGVRLWLHARDQSSRVDAYDRYLARIADFTGLLGDTRAELVELFAGEFPEALMREKKQAVFDRMRARYEAMKADWGGYAGYDRWFARELNNARLVAVATYRRYVPAFQIMYESVDEDLPRFYQLAEDISALPFKERRSRMDVYLTQVESVVPAN